MMARMIIEESLAQARTEAEESIQREENPET